MAATPESKVKKEVDKQLSRVKHLLSINPIGGRYAEPGVSDKIICVQGLFLAIEVKSVQKDPRPTPLQKKFLRHVRDAAGLVAVVDETNVQGLADWLEKAVSDPDHPQLYLNRPDAIEDQIKRIEV